MRPTEALKKLLAATAVLAVVGAGTVPNASASDQSLSRRLSGAAATYNRDAGLIRRATRQASSDPSGGGAALSSAAARLRVHMRGALAAVRADRASTVKGISARSLAIQGLATLVAYAGYELRLADALMSNAPASTRQSLAATASARARLGLTVLGHARAMLD